MFVTIRTEIKPLETCENLSYALRLLLGEDALFRYYTIASELLELHLIKLRIT